MSDVTNDPSDTDLWDQTTTADVAIDQPTDQGQQGRDEAGRFVAREQAAPEFKPVDADPKPQQPAEQAQQPERQEAQQSDAAGDASAPPKSWGAKAKAKWDGIDPEIRAEILRREGDVDRGFAQYAGLARHVDAAAKAGTTLPVVLDRYVAAEDLLTQDFTLGVAHLAQLVGVPLGHLVQDIQAREAQLAGQVPQPRQQPQPSQPRQPDIRSAVAEEIEIRNAQEAIHTFFADPKNRYAENVKPLMATFLQSGRATSLQQAYDMACRADPDVWAVIQNDLRAPAAPPAKQAAVQQAKRAAGSLTGSPPIANGRSARPGQSEIAADAEMYDQYISG